MTRDRVSIPLQIEGKWIELVDTGGYGFVDPDQKVGWAYSPTVPLRAIIKPTKGAERRSKTFIAPHRR